MTVDPLCSYWGSAERKVRGYTQNNCIQDSDDNCYLGSDDGCTDTNSAAKMLFKAGPYDEPNGVYDAMFKGHTMMDPTYDDATGVQTTTMKVTCNPNPKTYAPEQDFARFASADW